MMRLRYVCLTLFFFAYSAAVAQGQHRDHEVPLEVHGDVKHLIVVNKLPFTVNAPAGAGLYFWSVPSSIQAVDKGDKLEITAAPNGQHTVSVKLVIIDWEKKELKTKFGRITFTVGEPTPPPPPPPPPPQDEFERAVQNAWIADPGKSVYRVQILSQVFKQAAKTTVHDKTLKTVFDLYSKMKIAVDSLLAPSDLLGVRQVITKELDRVLPTEKTTPLDPVRELCSTHFMRVSTVLEALR